MNRNTQKNSPLFAEVNVGQRAAESRNRNDRRDKRFTFVKLTYPNGVTLTLPSDTDPEILTGYLRIKV
jgi:hypothetical protein